MKSTTVAERVEVLQGAVEAPQIVYPKGPVRRIVHQVAVLDRIAGPVLSVRLDVCGHEATLAGNVVSQTAIVRCAQCFHDAHRIAGSQTYEVVEDAEVGS